MATAKPPRVTKAYLDHYFALEEERKALARKSSDIRKQQDEIETRLMEHVREKGGTLKAVICAGYRLAIKLANGTVSWKNEYIKAAGQEAAEALVAGAEKKETLAIEEA